MKLTTLSAAVAATTLAFAHPAQAREQHRHYSLHSEARRHHLHEARRHYPADRQARSRSFIFSGAPDRSFESNDGTARRYRYSAQSRRPDWAARDHGYAEQGLYRRRYAGRRRAGAYLQRSASRSGYGGRPAAWCGWQMRQLVSADPGPSYNLARNWAHWGRSGPAGVGAVVVWPHHVGKIVGRDDGKWVIESGNDGHRLRTRPRSIAGAIAIRWGQV
jgi:hypothetical protein